MTGEEPRGDAEFVQDDPQQDQVVEPSAGGAVGSEPTGEQVEAQNRNEAVERIATGMLQRIPENQREAFAPIAVQAAKEAYESSGRVWQSRSTQKFQEASEMRREAELLQARAEEQMKMLERGVGGSRQVYEQMANPVQATLDRLDAAAQDAMRRENMEEALQYIVQKAVIVEAGPVFAQDRQEIQFLKDQLAKMGETEEKARLESDAQYQRNRTEVERMFLEQNGRLTRDECNAIVGAKKLAAENQVLRTGQVQVAAAQTAAKAANFVPPPSSSPLGGVEAPDKKSHPGSVDAAADAWFEQLPEGEIFDVSSAIRGVGVGGSMAVQNPEPGAMAADIAALRSRGQ